MVPRQSPGQIEDAPVRAEADESVPRATFGQIAIERPGEREFVLDQANLISDADTQAIKQLADKLLTDKAAPIIVVTIESMTQYGGSGLRIETFARLLFDQWGIGPVKLGDTSWNYGMLLLVSKHDRQARIELGAGWRREKDAVAEKIMNELIVPRFKSGDFSGGIVAGVEGLDKMARDLELPTRPRPTWHYLVGAVFFGLMVFTIISLIRRGSSGWAWLMWAAVFGIVGMILYQMATSRSSGGGGFSGGSFGGGSSGGGGATGSW
ncbi:MAG: TPM domain-containing protein [Pirellulales bacterium]